MSILYLCDAHNPVVGNSRILDVINPGSGNLITDARLNGTFPVLVPEDLPIGKEVNTVTELNTVKYAKLLAAYPEFRHILYEDFVFSPSVDLAESFGLAVGDRVSTRVGGNSTGGEGSLQTNVVVLDTTPTQALFYYQSCTLTEQIVNNRVVQILNEDTDSYMAVRLNFVGSMGGHDIVNPDSREIFDIPALSQGDQFLVQLSGFYVFTFQHSLIVSWALLY